MLIKKVRVPLKQLLLVGFLPSFLKIWVYRYKGYRIGKNVSIGLGSVVIGKDVEIRDNTKVGFLTLVRAGQISIGRYVNIGSFTYIDAEFVEIGEDSKIREQVYVGGLTLPDSMLRIGKRCLIMQMTFLNPTKPIIIGDDSAIGGNSSLFTHSSWLSQLEGYPVKFEPITIGKKVWIPWNTFITAGVNIGDNVIVGPGNVISQSIPSNSLANGNPLRVYPNIFKREMPLRKKTSILINITEEFCKYLEHYDYCVNKNIHLMNKIEIEIISGKNRYNFLLIDVINNDVLLQDDHDIIILTNSSINCEVVKRMIISITDLQRKGSSKLGEEFVRYLSRYGIRFERLD